MTSRNRATPAAAGPPLATRARAAARPPPLSRNAAPGAVRPWLAIAGLPAGPGSFGAGPGSFDAGPASSAAAGVPSPDPGSVRPATLAGQGTEPVAVLVPTLVAALSFGAAYAAVRAARELEIRRRRLRESEARYRSLFEHNPAAAFSLDTDGRITSVNASAERLSGYSRRDMLGRHFTALLLPDEARAAPARFREVLEGRPRRGHVPFRRKDGKLLELLVYGIPIVVEERIVGVHGIAEDMTELRRAEEALRRTGEELRTIVQGSPLAIIAHTVDDRITLWNRAAETIFGWPAEEALGRPLPFVPPDCRSEHLELVRRVARGERLEGVEVRRRRKDGSPVEIALWSAPLRDERGGIRAILSVVEDITERKRAEAEREELLRRTREAQGEAERRAREEAALREAAAAVASAFTVQETTRRIAESAVHATRADGAFVERVSDDGREVTVVAVAGERAPPLGARLPYAGSFTELVLRREAAFLAAPLGTAGHALPGDFARRCRDCAVLVVPLGSAGEPIGALLLIRCAEKDIFRPDEIERARTFGDLATLAFRRIQLLEEAQRRRKELERVIESRARLMRGFSHDVKNPLGAADGRLQLLEEGIMGELSRNQKDGVARARRSIRSAIELIEELLELARAEAGQMSVERVPTDVREVARESAEEYRAQAEGAGLRLELRLPGEFPLVPGDASRIRQILSNLLSNAIKYTPAGGRVAVAVERRETGPGPGPWIAVEVSDTGPGIPEEKQRLLFTEFARLGAGGRGSGVGLTIARRLARALGGDLTVHSRPGHGSTFTLWLPEGREGASPARAADGGAGGG